MAHSALNIENVKAKESLVFKKGYSALIKHLLVFVDLLLINISIILSWCIGNSNPFNGEISHFGSLIIVSNIIWLLVVYVFNIYAIARVGSWESIIWNVVKAEVVHCLIFSLFIITVKGYHYSRSFIIMYYLSASLFILLWRSLFVFCIKKYRETGHNFRDIIVVGNNKASSKLGKFFKNDKSNGYRLRAFFSEDQDDSPIDDSMVLLDEKVVYNYLDTNHIDEVYCTYPLTSVKKIRQLMSYCENNLIRFRYVPDFRALLYKNINLEFYSNIPVLSVRDEPLENINNRILKRLFDIIFSTAVLLCLFPLVFPVISIAILVTSRGPVFFKQLRSGKNNSFFLCYKFRTMTVNSKSDLLQATKNDARITPIGKFLRKSNLDELPQFINVLIGNMSVVGPRPHMISHTDEYKKTIDKFMIRHFVKPGITGWAQVNGFRGQTETPKKMIKRVRYDVWYIENWSLLLDIKIIFMTVFNMVKGEKNAF